MSRQWTEELEELLLDVTGRFVSWPERLQEFVNVLERREFTRMPTPPFTEEEMQTHFKELCEQVPIEVCSTRSMTWSAKRTELLLSIDSNTPGESYEVKTVLFNQAVKEKGWTFSASLLQVKKKLMAISSRRNLTTSNSTQSAQPIQERVTQIQVANQVSSKRERQKVDDVRDKNPKHQKIVSNSSAAGATTRSSTAANSKRAAAAAVAADNLLRGSASEKEHFCLSMNEFSGLESETENDGGATVNATARGKNDSAGGASSAVITPGHFGCKSVPIATMPVHSDDESGSEVGPSDETSDGTHEQGTSLEAEETGCTGQAETGIRAGALKKNEGGIVAVGTSGLGNMATHLRSLVNNKLMSDVTFLVEGSEIFAHRCICLRCNYFKNMLAGETVQSNADPVEISGVSKRAFVAVLEYIYTDSLDVSEDFVMEMFSAADHYAMETLKQICSQKLLNSVGVDNVANILQLAAEHGDAPLQAECFIYTLRNLEAVSKTKAFQEMAHKNPNMMVKIVQQLSTRTYAA